jgi:SAM-dependent methyltransferase
MKPAYYHTEIVHNLNAASELAPLIISMLKPASVLDIGCGTGTWLKVFSDAGIDVLGIDGDYLDRNLLKIPADKFIAADLKVPFDLGRKFDLGLCLEVAEHLPEKTIDNLISSISTHCDSLLFSAAIPMQAGQNHINEQWPEYWEKKFSAYGYKFHDVIRPEIWNNKNIDWWYRQNIFLVTKNNSSYSKTSEYRSLIHPENYLLKISNSEKYLEKLHSGKLGIGFAVKLLMKSFLYAAGLRRKV